MKKIIYILMFVILSSFVSAVGVYNISIEAQLINNSEIITGKFNITISIINSTDDKVFERTYDIETDSNGRFFQYLNVSYNFADLVYINWSIEGFGSFNKTLIGYVPYAINSQYIQGRNWSDIESLVSSGNDSIKSYVDDNFWNNSEIVNGTLVKQGDNANLTNLNITGDATFNNNIFGNFIGSITRFWDKIFVKNATIEQGNITNILYKISTTDPFNTTSELDGRYFTQTQIDNKSIVRNKTDGNYEIYADKIGIGTTTPTVVLHVVGDTNFTNNNVQRYTISGTRYTMFMG